MGSRAQNGLPPLVGGRMIYYSPAPVNMLSPSGHRLVLKAYHPEDDSIKVMLAFNSQFLL